MLEVVLQLCLALPLSVGKQWFVLLQSDSAGDHVLYRQPEAA